MRRGFTLLTLFLLFLPALLIGQYANVEHFHQEDGLPNDLIKSLDFDSLGFVWVATDDGLIKIEGKYFINTQTPQLFSNNFKNLLFTSKYGLLASADAGLLSVEQKFDGLFASFFNQRFEIKNWPKLVYPKTLFESTDSSIWLADLQKVYRINKSGVKTFDFQKKNLTDHFSRSYQFFELNENHFFVLSQTGFLYKLNPKTDYFIEVPWNFYGIQIYSVTKYNELTFLVGCELGILMLEFDKNGYIKQVKNLDFQHPVSVIKPFTANKFVLGTWRLGAYILTVEDEKFHYEFMKQSENQTINDIVVDKQTRIWLGTDMGLIMYRNVIFSNPFAHLTQRYIQDVRKGSGNTLFFTDGAKVYEVDEKFNGTPFFTPNKGLIITIQPDDLGIWMGTNDGRLLYKEFTGALRTTDFSKFGHGIYNLVIDKELNKWLIQSRPDKETLIRINSKGEITDFTPEMGKDDRVRALKLSPLGEVYIGASGDKNYLFAYNYQKQILENLSVPIGNDFDGQLAVNDIAFTDSGSLLLATKFGVWNYFKQINTQLNLGNMTNEMVSAIAIDDSNKVWLANSNGIIKYSKDKAIVFDNTDGLPAKTTNYRCLTIDSNNNLWIGTISGLAVGNLQFNEQLTPKPIIASIEKSGMRINLNSASKFVEKSHIAFNFATPIYPAKFIKYQYALCLNNDSIHWAELVGYSDHLILNDLNHGDYKLYIRAKIKGNYAWSEPFTYNFIIYKIWYTRPAVLIAIYLLVFFFIYIYTKLHQKKNEKEKKKLEEIIQNRTQSLSDQNEELKMLNTNLQIAKEESEAAIKAKDRFFSILAHDLKSPFNTLIGFSQLLVHNRNDISEESMQELFSEMLKTSENTYNLLQNLLEWAMSQTGALRIEKKQMLLIDLLNEILPTLDDTAKQKEIEIKLEFQDSLIVYADKALIGTVFRNLISNAIKFSHKKSVIRILGIEKNGITEISVIDSGVGIAKDKLVKLFAIDENVSTIGTANEIGTGLGLVLCYEFINKSAGSISVKSELGVGTTFVIQLPLN